MVGQWFCLERSDSRVLWERRFFRPNDICDFGEGIIVASETRSDGPWTFDFGCYGISLESGELLWTSHARGWWGRFLRLLDFVPAFTNEFRDMPSVVVGPECFCHSGRVLDVRTGQYLRRVSAETVNSYRQPSSDAEVLYLGRCRGVQVMGTDGSSRLEHPKVKLGEGRWLSHKRSADDTGEGGFRLYLLGEDNTILWTFTLGDTGYHINGNYFSYRLSGRYLHLLVSEEEQLVPIKPEKPLFVRPNPTAYHLLTLELNQGTVIQDIQVDGNKLWDCRIEDVDERGLLVSSERSRLWYYGRV